MSRVIIVRPFNSGDEASCKELIKNSMMSSLGATFCGVLLKELVFQIIILFSAIMFIFVGTSLIACLLVIPVVIMLMFVVTCVIYGMKIAGLNAEIDNIVRIYMSKAGSCFWVAEAFKSSAVTEHLEEIHYITMMEQQFCEANVQIPYPQDKKIVGIIGLCRSYRSEKDACIKMLYIHRQYYQRKSIAEHLIKIAVQFASYAGYSYVGMVASEYREEHKELCLRQGFELTKMYRQHSLGFFLSKMMYELTYEIKLNDKNKFYIKE